MRFYKSYINARMAGTGPVWASDTIKVALLTSSYTPNYDTHDFFDDITNEVTGTGYTAGGATLGSKTVTTTMADSWGVSRANSTAYEVGQIVRPATGNGYVYMCHTAGTSAGTIPTWPTVIGDEVTDGSVQWVNVGRMVSVIDAADPSWTSSTITARYAVYYKSTGTSSTSLLIGLEDFGSDKVSSNGTFQIQFAPAEGLFAESAP